MSMIDGLAPAKKMSGGQHAKLIAVVLITLMSVTACGNKEKRAGQSLVSVDGEEITSHQVNEELQGKNVPAAQQTAASKQVLEGLIDKQLVLAKAAKDKLDRDPRVVQAIERARTQIITQAYMQKAVANVPKPTKPDIEAYFKAQPQFFSERKQFDMKQLVLASKDYDAKTKAAVDAAKSLDEVATWLDSNTIKYARGNLVRTSSDLPVEMSSKMIAMPRTQLFLITEGDRTMLLQLADIKDAPVTLETASPQIEAFLFQKKQKEAADEAVKKLRGLAKIQYLNGADPKASAAASASATASVPVSAAASAAASVAK